VGYDQLAVRLLAELKQQARRLHAQALQLHAQALQLKRLAGLADQSQRLDQLAAQIKQLQKLLLGR
jgi:GR25 family glycosyltransferase involved in LPS biosynthesis